MKAKNNNGPSLGAIFVAVLLLVSLFGGWVLLASYIQGDEDVPDSSGYHIHSPLVNEVFQSSPKDVRFELEGKAQSAFSQKGLLLTVLQSGDGIRMVNRVNADTVSISLDLKNLIAHTGSTAKIKVTFDLDGDSWCSAEIEPLQYSIRVSYDYSVNGEKGTIYSDFFYDKRDRIDILVQVSDGSIGSGVDGISDSVTIPAVDNFEPTFDGVTVEAGDLTRKTTIVVQSLQLGYHSDSSFQDILHKTIVPDGKDFCFALHIHADRTYPKYFQIFANASQEYGLLGTYDAWNVGYPYQYGMDSPSYREMLHELDDAGWDIGIHAGGPIDLTREQIIQAIENITNEYGPIQTWSDHGYREQDLCINGTVVGSVYYIKDLVQEIGAGWWHDAAHSQSHYYDLNIEGMNYTLKNHEDIPLFRVSKGQALEFYQNPGRQGNVSSWLRAWAVERPVFVNHDYFPYFCYVTNATGKYSILPEHDGIEQTPWAYLNPKVVFQDGEWHLLPRFEAFLNWTKDYNVWFTTVRDVADRSSQVQQVVVEEDATQVIITNPTNGSIEGFTLYTKSMPDYRLVFGTSSFLSGKGTGDSWHFVMTLEPGVTILKKEAPEVGGIMETGQMADDGSSPQRSDLEMRTLDID